jgi:type II secretory pathway component PulC
LGKVVRRGAPYALAVLLAACGGAQDEGAKTTPGNAATAEAAAPEETELHRAALDGLLAQGPAYTLAMVQSEAAKENGKFVGFTIVSFRIAPPAYLGLKPGDVVTRVNGLPIETPDQFFAVFEALKAATEVKFDILRGGKPEAIVVPIVP